MTIPLAPVTPALAAALSDDELIAQQRSFAEARRLVDAGSAVLAAEIAHRSRRELGYDGLAASRGMRTPEALVEQVTGVSGADARALVRVGSIMADAAALADRPPAPWLTSVAAAVTAGTLSVHAAEAIRAGLGVPTETVTASMLSKAAEMLVSRSSSVALSEVLVLARQARADLDFEGIADLEEHRRSRRYLSLTRLADGMTRISGLLDPESAALVVGAVDAVTSPRRGGPRFVSQPAAADPSDDRTIPQLMLDALVGIVRVATLADTGAAFGARRVGVRVLVAERDLRTGTGYATIEGQPDAVAIATAERFACDSGLLPLVFDEHGDVLKLGRTQRLFTAKQKSAMAVRDGGCRVAGCDRPPDWCEAHHINEWLRDQGCTDIDDGILLCRHHHMLVHNNGWRIVRDDGEFWMVPPTSVDPAQKWIAMPSKSRVLARV
ncbi:HNH endonuclease signature motif containing protein [soil metagenome]